MIHKLEVSPQNTFIIIGIIFGLIFIILIPPFQVDDEPIHFYKAYDLSEGHIIPEREGSEIIFYIPQNMKETSLNFVAGKYLNKNVKYNLSQTSNLLNLPINNNDTVKVKYNLTYPPNPYIAAAFAIDLGKLFGVSSLMLLFLGRLANLLIWLFFVYLAIRITPVFKWVFLLLALMPMTIYLAASVSADSFTLAISFLSIAIFLKYAFDENKDKINKKEIILLLLLTVVLALSKQGYFLISLLFLVIPRNKFKNNKIRTFAFLLIFLIPLSISLYWNSLFPGIYLLGKHASVSGQIAFIHSKPLYFPYVIINTLNMFLGKYLTRFVGSFLWESIPLPTFMVYSYLLVLISISLLDKTKIKINMKQKTIFFVIASLIFILTFVYIYLTFTAVGNTYVSGVLGRYFIPIAPLIFLLLYTSKSCLKIDRISLKLPKNFSWFVILFIIIFLSATVSILVSNYVL